MDWKAVAFLVWAGGHSAAFISPAVTSMPSSACFAMRRSPRTTCRSRRIGWPHPAAAPITARVAHSEQSPLVWAVAGRAQVVVPQDLLEQTSDRRNRPRCSPMDFLVGRHNHW